MPTCSCLSGFTGSPLSGCRHECESDSECGAQENCKDFRCTSACSQCGQGAQCTRVQNHRAVCECPKVCAIANNDVPIFFLYFLYIGLHWQSIR